MKLNDDSQPTESTAVLVTRPDGLTLTLPAPGFLRGSPRFYVVWRLGWIALTALASLWVLFAPFLGNVPWDESDLPMEPGLVCLFLSPFWFIAAATLSAQECHLHWRLSPHTLVAETGICLWVPLSSCPRCSSRSVAHSATLPRKLMSFCTGSAETLTARTCGCCWS